MHTEAGSSADVDLLFNSSDAAQHEAATAASGDVRVYDFARPSLISKERKRALDAMYSVLAKSVELWLASRVRGQVELTLEGVEQLSYGEMVLSMTPPCAAYVFDVEDSGMQVVIDFGQEFAYFLVERLLGASGPPVVQQRPLTPLERMLVRIAADKVAEQLQEIWQDHVPLGLQMSRFESVPDMIQAANRQDPVLVGRLLVRATGVESTLTLCVPFAGLEKFFSGAGVERSTLRRPTGPRHDGERVLVQEQVRSARLAVAVRTPSFTLPMSDVSRLAPGATIITGLDPDPETTIYIEERARFTASVGRSGRHLAARILDVCDAAQRSEVTPQAKVTYDMENGDAGAALQQPAAAPNTLGPLMDLTLPVTIELGSTRMTVQEVLELGRGSIVQLDRLVGEPVDILVGERRFAEGEVVVLGEQFGVRITRIIANAQTPR